MQPEHQSMQLPLGTNPPSLSFPHFPTRQQAFIWRNWEMIPCERLAQILGTDEEHVLDMAQAMGLPVPPLVNQEWLQRGYITIIRGNWHLLPYEQLLQLLGWSSAKLAYTLKEDDFLWHKLGALKPKVNPIIYRPLTADEEEATARLRCIIAKHFPDADTTADELPFDFTKTLSVSEKPQLRSWEPVAAGDLVFTDGGAISCQETSGQSRIFTEQFVTRIRDRWGIQLQVQKTDQALIELVLDSSQITGEGHIIDVKENGVLIIAGDETGILRALRWIESEFENKGGPYLAKGRHKRQPRFDLRCIYPYFTLYGDPFLSDPDDVLPAGMLERLSQKGINGIWLQGLLYSLVPWSKTPTLSHRWQERVHNLRSLTRKAKHYGIGIYLYLNEPRALPIEFFKDYPELMGAVWGGAEEGYASLCTSHPEIKTLLSDSIERLFGEVPDLAGLFTITMSENPTNCHSRLPATPCPRCQAKPKAEIVAEVNALIAEGAHRVNPNARIMAYTWCWDEFAQQAIKLLPDGVSVLSVSEWAMPTNIGGVRGQVIDYSLSIVGPGEEALSHWQVAASRELPAVAKIQVNNTWECSAVPYLPVLQLVDEHLDRLAQAGVTGLMLSWTLGGYPSLNLDLVSEATWVEKSQDLVPLAEKLYGPEAAVPVVRAWQRFSDAFRDFPFHVGVLYKAPQNFGPANLLYSEPTGYGATMIGYPYDDLDTWRAIYPRDVFEDQFRRLSEGWKKGLGILKDINISSCKHHQQGLLDLQRVSEAAYLHLRSSYLQIAFVCRRDSLYECSDSDEKEKLVTELLQILDEEIDLAKRLHALVCVDSRIGYEATNHYYYTTNLLEEKVLNCEYLRTLYQGMLK